MLESRQREPAWTPAPNDHILTRYVPIEARAVGQPGGGSAGSAPWQLQWDI